MNRGGAKQVERTIANFTLSFGCDPGAGVKSTTTFVKDFIELCFKNFHIEEGTIKIPEAFSKVISNDANFESVTSNLAQELCIQRQDIIVGHKLLIFAVSIECTPEMKKSRFLIQQFFK